MTMPGCKLALLVDRIAANMLCNLSHLRYTLPPAIALTACYRPLCTPLDRYKILFLIVVCSPRAMSILQSR